MTGKKATRFFWMLIYFGGYPVMALAGFLAFGNWADTRKDLAEDYKMLVEAK